VGTITTAAAGASANVTNSGTSAAAVFNFTIPRGATGATGPQGPAGSDASSVGANRADYGLVTESVNSSSDYGVLT
jgi:hypothetical protein